MSPNWLNIAIALIDVGRVVTAMACSRQRTTKIHLAEIGW